MCMCSFAGAAVLQNYDPAKSRVKKFRYTPGQGLQVTHQGQAPSEARRSGNRFWQEGDQPDAVPTTLTSGPAAPDRHAQGLRA